MISRQVLSLLILLVCLMTVCSSQTETATVSGRISDEQGAVVPGADLVLTNVDTNLKVRQTSNKEGLYVFSGLKPGRYLLAVSKSGFRKINLTDVVLNVQDAINQNFQLQVGSVSESVTVVAESANVNTSDGSVSTVVDRRFVENMPLNGRSFQTLVMLAPGVVVTPANASSPGQFSVNGQRADANYFTVDGVSANIGVIAARTLGQSAGGSLPGFTVSGGTNSLVSVDALQEFRIQTSSFAPEFGRTPGAQVSLATRSGTNQFHGLLFDYLRNDILDANNWFADHNGQPKPKERQNDFGGVLGGPIVKDRTFFFFSYEGLRLRQPVSATTAVPSASSRQAASQAIRPFLDAYSLPNGPDLGNGFAQFATSYSVPAVTDAYSIRVDHLIGPRLALFGRYNYSPSSTTTRGRGGVLSATTPTSVNTHTLTIGLTESISSRINNEVRGNYSNVRADGKDIQDTIGGAIPLSDAEMFPQGSKSSDSQFLLTINGAGTLFSGRNATNEQRQVNVLDNLGITIQGHQLKFGVDYRWLAPIADIPAYSLNVFFLGINGSGGILSGVPPFGGNIFAQQPATLLQRNLSFYGQDTWKLTPSFTLTYGLRWDINPPLKGKGPQDQPFAGTGLDSAATVALAPPGTPLFDTTYGNVAPRIGAAYRLSGVDNRATVIRAGFGIFYDVGSGFLGQLISGFPFTTIKNLGATPFPFTAQQAARPTITQAPPVKSQWTVPDPHLELPRTYEWNVAIEQSLGQNQSISATYLGALGRNLLRQDNFSAPNANFTSLVSVTRNSGTSDYDALQLKFQRRLSAGLQSVASYTWSHSIDNASNDWSFFTPASIGNANIDRGNSEFDVRHAFNAAVSYDIPFRDKNPLARVFFRDWSLDSFITGRTAFPVNLLGPTFVVGGAQVISRPSVVPGVPFYIYGSAFPGGKAINRAAFTNPPTGQQGTLGRDILRGFGDWQLDLTARRQFHLTEKVALQLRTDFFNILNHPNFGDPGAGSNGTNQLTSPLFGRSTQTLASSLGAGGVLGGFSPLYQVGGPRSIQVALKLQF